MAEEISFIVNGMPIELTATAVEEAMRGIEPEPIRRHRVTVGDVQYPVKQVFERVTGLDRLDFTSATARRHLGKLGFKLSRNKS